MEGATKGKATMLDLAHGTAQGGAGQRLELGNLEPLMHELIKAVQNVSVNVRVPDIGPPEVTFQQPDVRLDFMPLVAAITNLKPQINVQPQTLPAPEVKVQTPISGSLVAYIGVTSLAIAIDITLRIAQFFFEMPFK